MAVTATFQFLFNASETLAGLLATVADPTIKHDIGSAKTTIDSGTAASPVTKAWSDEVQLSGGTISLDLQALVGFLADAVDLTGLKIQGFHIKADVDNSAVIVIKDGASNGYELFGAASGQVTLPANGEVMFFSPEGLDDVAAADSEIDVTSSDVDAKFKITIIAG